MNKQQGQDNTRQHITAHQYSTIQYSTTQQRKFKVNCNSFLIIFDRTLLHDSSSVSLCLLFQYRFVTGNSS